MRADEIQDTGLIDRSMYALLVRADVVIADISTMNPNAIYELGVRHAVKPQSTIILRAESSTSIPFDINHTRVFSYKHLGEDIGVDEAKRMQDVLKEKLNYILIFPHILIYFIHMQTKVYICINTIICLLHIL